MKRRSLVIAGLVGLFFAPKWSGAQQQPNKIPRVGILTLASSDRAPMFDAFRKGLRDLGYVEGRNIILEFRFAGGDRSRVPQLAAEVVALPVDVIVTEGFPTDVVDPSGGVPIVSPVLIDPVQRGFATSLARPGKNLTGFTLMHIELDRKRLELLHTGFPHITAVAALINPASPNHELAVARTETAARSMGLGDLRRVEAESPATLRTLRPIVFSGADAVVVTPDGMFYNYHRDVVALVNAARLPAIYPEREYADDGGLMSYGTNVPDNFRRAADYVDRILKGAKPADLPIQHPTKFELAINLKTAKALGLQIPDKLLALADEVIE